MAIVSVLLGVILVLLLPYLPSFYSFIYVHFLHKSTINRYLYGSEPYAVITGASDGIGKALSLELYKLGFNLVIHGRNKAKLDGVRFQLVQSAVGTGKVICLVADAGTLDCDFEKIGKELEGLNVTLLINNVGGTSLQSETLDHQSFASVLETVNLNAFFPLRMTQLLLPRIRALPGPGLILFTGSIASEICPPYLGAYACSKSFLATLVRSFDFDERAFVHSDVQFMYLQTGPVVSGDGVISKRDWRTPLPQEYARAAIQKIGCGQRVVCPWTAHAFLRWAMQALGERVAEAGMMASFKSTTNFDDKKTK